MEMDSKNQNFPSDFLSPKEKNSQEYAKKWTEAIHSVGLTGSNNGLFPGNTTIGSNPVSKFAEWRSYARGNQPIDKYKPQLGVRDKRARRDPNAISYRALNWEILDVATKYVNVLIGKLIKQNNDIGVMAVDKQSQDARRKKLMELQEYALNGNFLKQVTAKTGIAFEEPLQDDVMETPKDMATIKIYMDHFYKEDFCMIVQDLLKLMNEADNFIEVLSEIARDLVEVATGATKVYRVGRKIITRRCVPEKMVISYTNKSLCDDVKYVAEYWDLTVSQFKEIAGSQFTEEEYRTMAEKASSTQFNNYNAEQFFAQNMCYPWDNTKITVLDAVWFSADWETYQVGKNQYGDVAVTQKEYSWWTNLEKKGVKSAEEFNKVNQSQVIRYALNNQYQALWVVGTKYVCNYGKSKDMLRNESSLGKAVGPYTIYKMKKCIMETIIPTLDNIQLNYLQYQHHAAKSVPDGVAIEFTALQDISIEGAGGKKLSPKEALQIYFETGILLWRRRDAQGNLSNFKPVDQLAGTGSNKMEKHFQAMLNGVSLMRDQIGLNELTDASTPNSEMGKAVATMASGSSDDALRGLFFAFDQVNIGTNQRRVMHISGMAATGLAPEYTEALGIQSMAVIALLSDLTTAELGVYLMRQPTQEMRMWINEYCKAGITSGSLYEEEAFEIQMEPNIWRAIRLLKLYRKQKNDLKQSQMQEQYKAEQEKNIASAQATAQAQQGVIDIELQGKSALIDKETQAKMMLQKQKASDDAFLLQIKHKLEKDQALSLEEERRMTELMKVEKVGEYQLAAARERPKTNA